jgi:GNAT superfamily N-acetyltransferase
MLDQTELLMRPAAAADLRQVLDLYAQPDFDAGNVLPLETARQLFDRFDDYPDYTLYVAERGGDIVGSFALLVMPNLGHLGAPSAILEDVVVTPALQGQGIGKAMIRFVLDLCRAKGCYKVTLASNAKRKRRGLSFRVGFAQVEVDQAGLDKVELDQAARDVAAP